MNFSQNYDIEEPPADQITYELLFQEWLKNYVPQVDQSENFTANESLIAEFNEFIRIFSPQHDSQFQNQQLVKNTIVIILYTILIIVSLFGNLLVCHVILSKRRMRFRTTNILIANLAASDLLMTTFTIPVTTSRLLLDNWVFGSALCKLAPFIQVTSVYVSTISMTIIAIDRYQVLVGPLGRRLSTSIPTFIIILFIWILSGLLSIPHAIFNQVVELFTFRRLIRCRAVYPKPADAYRQWITVSTFVTQYFIPLALTMAAYTVIGIQIWKRVGLGVMTESQITNHIKSKRRTIKMLCIVVVVFAVCWFPINIYHIRTDFRLTRYSSNTFLACHWFAMSSVCYNPFIYFWLNKNYREGAKSILLSCFGLSRANKSVLKTRTNAKISNNNNQGSHSINKINNKLTRSNAIKISRPHTQRRFMNNFDLICVKPANSNSLTSSSSSSTKLTQKVVHVNAIIELNQQVAEQVIETRLFGESKL